MNFIIYLFLCTAIAYFCGKNGMELPSDNTMIIIAILLVAENIFWKRTK